MSLQINLEDRITYAQAQHITGRSHGYLAERVRRGELNRVGGAPIEVFETWLSRQEIEQLALAETHRSRYTDYWLTMTEAAKVLGIARTAIYRARDYGRLSAFQSAHGTWLVRRFDIEGLAADQVFAGQQNSRGDSRSRAKAS